MVGMRKDHTSTPSYWGVRVGARGRYAKEARDHGFVAIEWDELGDVSWMAAGPDDDQLWKKVVEAYQTAYGTQGLKASVQAGQVLRFAREIQDGDIVLTPNTVDGVVYLGRIKGGFYFVDKPTDRCPYRQRRHVEWLQDLDRSVLPQPLINSLGSIATVYSVAKAADHIRALLGEHAQGQKGDGKPDIVKHLLARLYALRPKDFEEFVADYFRAIGYDAKPTQYVSDGGIDVAGMLDAEGLAQVLLRVQVKAREGNVGIDAVLKTRGALEVDEQGAIITLGGFTDKAEEEAEAQGKKRILLVGGETFAEMLLSHWDDLSPKTQELLGIRPKAAIPVRERFEVAE
jgi:restriction system protein